MQDITYTPINGGVQVIIRDEGGDVVWKRRFYGYTKHEIRDMIPKLVGE